MQTSNIHLIREAVILLLRNSGCSLLEATDQWNRVYSQQYTQAKPGHTYTWLIGGYEFIFTRQGEPRIVAAYQPKPRATFAWWWLALGTIAIALVIGLAN